MKRDRKHIQYILGYADGRADQRERDKVLTKLIGDAIKKFRPKKKRGGGGGEWNE